MLGISIFNIQIMSDLIIIITWHIYIMYNWLILMTIVLLLMIMYTNTFHTFISIWSTYNLLFHISNTPQTHNLIFFTQSKNAKINRREVLKITQEIQSIFYQQILKLFKG